MKKIFLIVGKACAGKDTLVKQLLKDMKISMAISFTTRPKREGETDGVEYNFITIEELNRLDATGELIESTSYNVASGDIWYYGLTKKELEKDNFVLAIVNPEGAEIIKNLYGDKVETILITANDKERINRYLKRDNSDNVAECCRRFLADEKDFENFKADYIIDNYDVEIATMRLFNYISIEMANTIHYETQKDFINDPAKYLGDK